jgi:hypothetical protein
MTAIQDFASKSSGCNITRIWTLPFLGRKRIQSTDGGCIDLVREAETVRRSEKNCQRLFRRI